MEFLMMKNTMPYWIAIGVLLAVIAGIGVKFIVLGSTAKGTDERTAVLLEEGERQLVLEEMRSLLEATQQVLEGLSDGDMKQIDQAATAVGMQATSTMDVVLKAKLPMEFKKLGFATHTAFDEIAAMARNASDTKAMQKKLADTMNNCIACHTSFQIPSTISKGGNS
jgi:cytochrome c556